MQKYPKTDLLAACSALHAKTCVDSLIALQALITYIAEDGDLRDTTRAPSPCSILVTDRFIHPSTCRWDEVILGVRHANKALVHCVKKDDYFNAGGLCLRARKFGFLFK